MSMSSRNKAWTGAYDYLVVKLKEARLDARMTQDDVARRLGRPQSFVSKIETNGHGVYAVDLVLLARMYNKPLAFFVQPAT